MLTREKRKATAELTSLRNGGAGNSAYATFLAERVLPGLPSKYDDGPGGHQTQFRALWAALPAVKRKYAGNRAIREEIPVMDTDVASRAALLVAFFDDDAETPNPALPKELQRIRWRSKDDERWLTDRKWFVWLTNDADLDAQAHLEEIAERALERLMRSLPMPAQPDVAAPVAVVPLLDLAVAERAVLVALQSARTENKRLTAKELTKPTGLSVYQVKRAVRALPKHGYPLNNPQNGAGYGLLG